MGGMCNFSKQRYVYLITLKGVENCIKMRNEVLPELCFILIIRIHFGIYLHIPLRNRSFELALFNPFFFTSPNSMTLFDLKFLRSA